MMLFFGMSAKVSLNIFDSLYFAWNVDLVECVDELTCRDRPGSDKGCRRGSIFERDRALVANYDSDAE